VLLLLPASCFLFSSSLVWSLSGFPSQPIRTGIFPCWMAFLGYALALLLLLSIGYLYWAPVVFPLRVLLISGYKLLANLKPVPASAL
jgi:hypothetical protein